MPDSTPIHKGYKRCNKCSEIKPATAEFFLPNKKCKLGITSCCRVCQTMYLTNYRRNKGEKARIYREITIDGLLKCSTCHQLKPATSEFFGKQDTDPLGFRCRCRECNQKKKSIKRLSDGIEPRKIRRTTVDGKIECLSCGVLKPAATEFFGIYDGKVNENCRNCVNEINRQNYNRDRQKILARRQSQYKPGQNSLYAQRWRQRNPQKVKTMKLNRRAAEYSLPSAFTPTDWQYVLIFFDFRCAVCGRPQGLWHTLAADHWIPISDPRPDNPGTVTTNIVPLCHGVDGCNNSKGNRDPIEWLNSKFGKRKTKQILARIETYFDSVKNNATKSD